jgi:molybdopterin-biosynthesis enzyme MoeA-like protein
VQVSADVAVVADVRDRIGHDRASYDYLFTTGGIGPTHDDTVDAVAQALGIAGNPSTEARAILERYYADRGRARDQRADCGWRGCRWGGIDPHRMSGAPGIKIGNVFLMAGVPHITTGMLDALTGTGRWCLSKPSVAGFPKAGGGFAT